MPMVTMEGEMEITMAMVQKSVARGEQANTAGPMSIADTTVKNAKTNQLVTSTLHISSPNKKTVCWNCDPATWQFGTVEDNIVNHDIKYTAVPNTHSQIVAQATAILDIGTSGNFGSRNAKHCCTEVCIPITSNPVQVANGDDMQSTKNYSSPIYPVKNNMVIPTTTWRLAHSCWSEYSLMTIAVPFFKTHSICF